MANLGRYQHFIRQRTTRLTTSRHKRSKYYYSAGELLDGPGHGTDNFAMPAAAKQVLVGGACYDQAGLIALGTSSSDVYNPAFVSDVGGNCAVGGDCSSAASTLWLSRWKTDRPPIDKNGAPILVLARRQRHVPGCPTSRSACWTRPPPTAPPRS